MNRAKFKVDESGGHLLLMVINFEKIEGRLII